MHHVCNKYDYVYIYIDIILNISWIQIAIESFLKDRTVFPY